MKTDEFRRLVNAQIKVEFAKLGFKKKKWHYLYDINEETVGLILLNHVSYRGQGFAGAPIVGVRNSKISQLVHELFLQKESEREAEFATNIGYLMSINKWVEWQFHESANIDKVIQDMVSTIKKYGITFMKRMSDREGLLEEISIRPHINPNPWLFVPALYLLLGRKSEAIKYTQEVVEGIRTWKPDHNKVADRIEEQVRQQGYIVMGQRPEPESPEEIAKIRDERLKYYVPFAKRVAEYGSVVGSPDPTTWE